MATTSYASVAELEAYWRPLDASEEARAEVMLGIASSRLRLYAANSGVDIDSKFNSDDDYKAAVKWVVMEATKRALATPIDTPPVDTFSQTAGPYSENLKFTNPSGDLWFKKAELKTLGISGNQQVTSITPTTRKDIYGE